MGLHPCCHPIQIMRWFIWEVTIVLFVHSSMQSVACDTLRSCNLLNESLRGLNRPFPSSLVPLFQNESKCETIQMEMSLI